MENIMKKAYTTAPSPLEMPKLLFLAILAACKGLKFERDRGMLLRISSSGVDAAVLAIGITTLLVQPKNCLEVRPVIAS